MANFVLPEDKLPPKGNNTANQGKLRAVIVTWRLMYSIEDQIKSDTPAEFPIRSTRTYNNALS